MATTPNFTATPKTATGQVTTAQTTRDNPGSNIVTVVTSGASGSKIERIRICGTGTTTAGVVRLYKSDGTNHRLWKEVLVTAITPSTTVAVFESEVDCSGPGGALLLISGWSLRATTHNTETFNVHVEYSDY